MTGRRSSTDTPASVRRPTTVGTLTRDERPGSSVSAPGYGPGMAEKKGKGSATAKKANAKASKEGKKNPRTSSAAQAELGKKGGKTKKKKSGKK